MAKYGRTGTTLTEPDAGLKHGRAPTEFQVGMEISQENPERERRTRVYETDREAIERGENEGMRCAFRLDNGPAAGAQDPALGVSPDHPTPQLPKVAPDVRRTAS